jgi:hypothetical protein
MIVTLVIIVALVIAGIVASIRTVSIDGYRRIPNTPVARRIESVHH